MRVYNFCKKNTINTAIKNTKIKRRKLHCPRIKKKAKSSENKKTSIKKLKKIQKIHCPSTFNFLRLEEILIKGAGAGAGTGAGWSIPATQVPMSAPF